MRKYLPPSHKFRPKTLDSTDTVDFTHFRRTVNRYCDASGLKEFIRLPILYCEKCARSKSIAVSLKSERLEGVGLTVFLLWHLFPSTNTTRMTAAGRNTPPSTAPTITVAGTANKRLEEIRTIHRSAFHTCVLYLQNRRVLKDDLPYMCVAGIFVK